MKARDFINALRALIAQFGNLPIAGGTLHDDVPPRRIVVIDAEGCETDDAAKAVAFFVEG